MISILIPEHNFDCVRLVGELLMQCQDAGITYEIIVMDDASTLHTEKNKQIGNFPCCEFLTTDTNIGQATVRNRLAKIAKYPHLLFIDCDAAIVDNHFIKRYLDNIGKADVIIGGVTYSHVEPPIDKYLRWYYGKKRESSSAHKREKETIRLSFNFLIEKDVQLKYPFNEDFTDYGHEDTIIGYLLKQNGVKLMHIDNPLIHTGLDENHVFLAKSRKAVEKYVTNKAFSSEEIADQIKIFRAFKRVKGIRGLLGFKYRIAGKMMENNLCGNNPSLFIFDLYRLCYLCYFYNQERKHRK